MANSDIFILLGLGYLLLKGKTKNGNGAYVPAPVDPIINVYIEGTTSPTIPGDYSVEEYRETTRNGRNGSRAVPVIRDPVKGVTQTVRNLTIDAARLKSFTKSQLAEIRVAGSVPADYSAERLRGR